jgi:hypothetical protein
MTRHVQLDPITHRALRIDTRRAAALGDEVMLAPTFPGEFRELQAHYPIVFHVESARVQPVALLGLQQGRNLFLSDTGWDAHYVPLAIERQPFLVGVDGATRTLHVDLDHPRVQSSTGEPVFLPHGGTTDYLQRMQAVLATLHDGLSDLPAFAESLQTHALLEPFALDVRLDDGRQHRLAGFHSIDESRLRTLAPETVAALHAAGHLEPVYMAMASLSRLRDLIERMNRRHAHD